MPLKLRGRALTYNRVEKFATILEDYVLVDLGAYGKKIMWFRKCSGVRTVAKRLDRALFNLSWHHEFPKASLKNLPCMHSDHVSILLHFDCD